MRYQIKCDECKTAIGETDSLAESAAGGKCDRCRTPFSPLLPHGRGYKPNIMAAMVNGKVVWGHNGIRGV